MKKSILFLLFILSLNNMINAQQAKQYKAPRSKNVVSPYQLNQREVVIDYDHYIKKRNNQRAAGWTTLVGGVVLSGVGLLITNSQSPGSTGEGGTILLITGAISGIVSIPCMIMASVYNRKAKLMLKNQKTGFGVPSNVGKNIPGFTLVIPVGK